MAISTAPQVFWASKNNELALPIRSNLRQCLLPNSMLYEFAFKRDVTFLIDSFKKKNTNSLCAFSSKKTCFGIFIFVTHILVWSNCDNKKRLLCRKINYARMRLSCDDTKKESVCVRLETRKTTQYFAFQTMPSKTLRKIVQSIFINAPMNCIFFIYVWQLIQFAIITQRTSHINCS